MRLLDAVERGDTAAVAELLHDGADPNSRNKIGEPALFVAVMNRHVDVAEMLLNAGATVDLETPRGATALMMSPGCRSVDLVKLLIDRGANVNHSNGVGTALAAAVQLGLEDVVEVLLDAGANNKASPIIVAAERGLLNLVWRLLVADANLHSVDKEGYGAVFHAANRGHADMIRLLVSEGADPNATAPNGVTPLYAACMQGHVAAVVALLQVGANVNQPDASPCLIPAASYGHSEIVSQLLSHGVDVNVVDPEYGATALCAAAMGGHAEVVRQLAYARAELDKPASNGLTPELVARHCSHMSVLVVLQEVRTKKMELLDAVRHGNLVVVRALLDEGLSVNQTDEHDNTLIHLALLGRHDALLAELLEDPAVDTSRVNKFHESPTAIATKLGVQSLIEMLQQCQNKPVVQVPARLTEILRELGRGSYGIVVKDSLFGQDVAVKVLLNSGRKAAKSLRYEIEVLKTNPSPYLVRLLATADAATDSPQLFYEFMDGGNLTSYLEKIAADDSVPVVYAPIEILWVVANALNDLHAKNMVHRDIKTDNIFLSSVHYIKLGGVGIAKEESTNMMAGAGTSKWMAPEVLMTGSSYGPPADIYSFGILLQTLFPNPHDASTEWVKTLAAECTDVDPARRLTAAKLVGLLRPKLQSQPHLVSSMDAFEKDKAAGLQVLEAISVPAHVEAAAMPVMTAAPVMHSPEELHVAVETGKVDDVRALLASGVHPDCAGTEQETPLMKAIHYGYIDIVDLLLEYRADVNIASLMGVTPLHYAARQSDSAILEKLLRIRTIDVDAKTNKQQTPLHAAIADGRLANVIALLDAGADIEAVDEDLQQPLHYAALFGHKDIAAVLLERGARTSDRNKNGDTVLHLAIRYKHGDVATLVIQAGADISADSKGQSPMHSACEHGVVDVIPALIAQGADVNSQFNYTSPLMMATHRNHADVVTALVRSPDTDVNQPNNHGFTALHIAVSTRLYDIVRTLLQAGVDVDHRDLLRGVRAIDLAVAKKDRTMIELLRPAYEHRERLLEAMRLQDVGRLANLLQQHYSCNVKDELGCSLVHLAVLAQNEAMLDLLLADSRVRLATLNNAKKTPLAIAIERGHASMVAKLFARVRRPVDEISATDYSVTTTELDYIRGVGGTLLGSYLGQEVAVKMLKSTDSLQAFQTEVDGLLACPSPYLVRLVAIADRNSKTPALLFQYMDGGSLRTHLNKKWLNHRTSAHVTSLQVAWVVANALRDLHAKNLIHRDVKSDNVLLNSSDEIKLGNMGLANRETTETPGTPFWMAPEILQAEGAVDGFPADIYAFGVLLTELDTCQLPYFDQDVHDDAAFVRGVVNDTLRPTLTAAGEPWLRRLVEMCLLGDPAARPTADQIVEMLQHEMTAAKGMSVTETAKDDVTEVMQAQNNEPPASPRAYLAALALRDVQESNPPGIAARGKDDGDVLGLPQDLPGKKPTHSHAMQPGDVNLVKQLLTRDHRAANAPIEGQSTQVHLAVPRGHDVLLLSSTIQAQRIQKAMRHDDILCDWLQPLSASDTVTSSLRKADAGSNVQEPTNEICHVRPEVRLDEVTTFSSPYVVRVVAGHAPDVVVLEPMQFGSLRQVLKSLSAVAPAEQRLPKLHIAIAVARALVDLHGAGLFHGSLSSHSVFRSTEYVVKVGVPGTTDPSVSMLPWTAPERLGVFAPCTPEADVYALGIILTELHTLRAPFEERNWSDAQLMTAVGLRHDYPRLTGGCASWYAALVNECLQPDPTKRPTATTIVATLNAQMAANGDDALAAPTTDAGRHLRIRTELCVSPLIMAIKIRSTSVVDALHQHNVVPAIEVTAPRDVAPLQELGRGLRSIVYKAQISGVDVAIKTCHKSRPIPALLSNPSPYLVQIVAVAGRNTATPQLVLEYMDGGNVRSYLDQTRLLEPTAVHVTAVEVAYVVANALKDLHKQGVVHGSVKSANVLLSSTSYIKLDVTLASERTAAETQTLETLPWLAPEILRADGPVDGLAADMYAFGVLLAELETLHLPYDDQPALTPPVITQRVVDGTLRPRLSTACEQWYRELKEACLRGDPKERVTADDVVKLLNRRLAKSDVGANRDDEATHQHRVNRQRRTTEG